MKNLKRLEKIEANELKFKAIATKNFDARLKKLELIKTKYLFKQFNKDKYIQEKIKELDNHTKAYYQGNDINGVDIHIDFNIDSYTNVIDYLRNYLESEYIYINIEKDYNTTISMSTADEGFYTDEGYLYFMNKHHKVSSELEAVLLFEKLCIEYGYSPSLYYSDRYGNCSPIDTFKFIDKDLLNLDNSKDTLRILDILIEIEKQEYNTLEIEKIIDVITPLKDISNIEVNYIKLDYDYITLDSDINYNFTCDIYDANNELIEESKSFIGTIKVKDLI